MKNVILIVALCAPVCGVWGQTVEKEREILNAALKNGTLTPNEVQARVKALKEIESIYPKMPYDTAGNDIVANQVISFPGVGKAQAFERAKEWASINFGSLAAVTDYEYAEGGKLNFEGWTRIVYTSTYKNIWGNIKETNATSSLLFSLLLTIKDGKAKVQYKNVRYRVTVPAYVSSSGLVVPAQEFIVPVSMAFPVAMSDPSTWRGTISFFNAVMSEMNATVQSVEAFLRATPEDSRF